ncbi:hypothetical protein [Pararhodospirillum oryzae]|uniref:Uncharacterized protein n=1 Tax=Pararhodospirillum oryzae TaxID=478448 RepID=A0A512H442_9PROT|nr:hypothetical protein [Pararhodospirillum oryzae]GEO80207.1 hypothetical protein ROR02_03380 [Pararhodospirillum oryzae]
MPVVKDIGWLELELEAARQAERELKARLKDAYGSEERAQAFLDAFDRNRRAWTEPAEEENCSCTREAARASA